jgi:lysyl-tRNA synthetase, class II
VIVVLRLERHRLGPRVYVLGRRVHEWQLGFGVGAAALTVWLAGSLDGTAAAALGAAAAWLVLKDWRDLVPSQRDTAAWRLGVHRRLCELRPARRAAWLPPLAASAAALVAAVDLVSALTPNAGWRGDLLVKLVPVEAVPVSHALAVPASVGLLVTALYLARRRRRAWRLAFGILLALSVLNLLKGLDLEESTLDLALAGLLWWGRGAFDVRHDPISLGSAVWRLPALGLGTGALAFLTALVAAPAGSSLRLVLRETVDLLLWSDGPVRFRDELVLLPIAVGVSSAIASAIACYVVFRPLAAPRSLPSPELRRAAAALVHEHGRDTLAFFKLRRDKQYLFDPSGRAFLGYRVESGVLVVSGDPVGVPEALPALVAEACRFAELRGLRIAAVGANEAMLPLWRSAGLRALYLGDEAIVATRTFSLDGRQVRKVRQSVSRLEREGYAVELVPPERLDETCLAQLETVSERWRGKAPERGFAMAMDSITGEHASETALAVARDAGGTVRAYMHLVPSFGRPAMSLSAMRRDPDTPNGLMEFLVAKTIELLRMRGVEDVSLNFAAFNRFLQSPAGPGERLLGRCIALANPYFQIESLYRFNAKFFPRWEPRYLVYERALALPRVGLAVMLVEGQLRKPRLLRRAA